VSVFVHGRAIDILGMYGTRDVGGGATCSCMRAAEGRTKMLSQCVCPPNTHRHRPHFEISDVIKMFRV
jgi:hypothetical protein